MKEVAQGSESESQWNEESISEDAGLHRVSKMRRNFCLEQGEVSPAGPI